MLVATTEAGDSLPIGQALREVGVYPEVLEKAWSEGEASSEYFEEQGVDYKWGFVRLGQSDAMLAVRIRADYRAPLNEFRTNILVSSGIATLFAALLAALMATTVTRPVERLSFAARRIRKGRMDRAVPLEPGLELGRLSRAMERMRKGIMRRDEQLRLMLAQVAHEIRNPLEGLELFAAAAEETDDSEEGGAPAEANPGGDRGPQRHHQRFLDLREAGRTGGSGRRTFGRPSGRLRHWWNPKCGRPEAPSRWNSRSPRSSHESRRTR